MGDLEAKKPNVTYKNLSGHLEILQGTGGIEPSQPGHETCGTDYTVSQTTRAKPGRWNSASVRQVLPFDADKIVLVNQLLLEKEDSTITQDTSVVRLKNLCKAPDTGTILDRVLKACTDASRLN